MSTQTLKTEPPLPTKAEFDALVKRANDGQPGALDQLKAFLGEHPSVWQQLGDMGQHSVAALHRAISGGDQLALESLRRKTDELRQELEGPDPTPLERLAVQRVLVAHLEVEFVAVKFPEANGVSIQQQRQVLRVKDSAQRRFDAAMKSLLLLRSLPLATRGEPEEPQGRAKRVAG